MNSRGERIPPDRIAQASAWVATLHGDRRTAQTEQAFQRWLGDDPLNAQAFEQITDLWEVTGNLPRRHISPGGSVPGRTRALGSLALTASVVIVCAIGALLYFALHEPGISTDTGEQRIVALEDGTQVTLNTHTDLTYRFDNNQRHVDLKRGEALFEIAKDAARPFTVTVDHRTITALGTRFAVRKDEFRTTVTLIDGKVSVTDGQTSPSQDSDTNRGTNEIILTPGQRLTLARATQPRIDQPLIDNVLAWKRREVFLDETPLSDAIAEMNRYSKKTLIAPAAGTDDITVTGLFRAGDSISFAHAVADTYGLRVTETAEHIRLESP